MSLRSTVPAHWSLLWSWSLSSRSELGPSMSLRSTVPAHWAVFYTSTDERACDRQTTRCPGPLRPQRNLIENCVPGHGSLRGMCMADNDGANCLAVRLPSTEKGYEQDFCKSLLKSRHAAAGWFRCYCQTMLLEDSKNKAPASCPASCAYHASTY